MLYAQNSLISMFDLLQEPALKITDNFLKDNTEKLNFISSLFFNFFPRRKLWMVRQRHACYFSSPALAEETWAVDGF